MKKIYSFLLIATALLFSTNLWAETYNISASSISDLIAGDHPAFNHNGNGDTYNVTLNNNIIIENQTLWMGKNSADEDGTADIINLDLNGHTLTLKGFTETKIAAINLYKGTLNINGSGTIKNDDANAQKIDLIRVYGAWDDVANWSTLTIDKDVKVESSHYNAITIDCHAKKEFTTTDPHTIINGTTYRANGAHYSLGDDYGHAYGVNITISGVVYGYKYGIKVNGNVVGTGENAPKIHLTSTSDVIAFEASTSSVAVYSSGYASWNIEGNVEGANGVYVKSGKVAIDNATITSSFPGTPNNIYGKSSGVNVGGMAICIESNDSYVGGQEVTISGDSKVTAGTNGAAILEKIATNDDESKVSNITINGGTFEGGKEGSIIIEDDTKENTVIYGANVAVAEGGDQTDTDIQNLLEQLKPVGTTVVEVEDAQGHTTYVVTEFDGQAPTATPFTISANNDEDNRADFDLSGLDLSLANDFAIGDVEGNSPENIYLGAVILNHATGITINVNKNSTLTVKSLVMGVNDVINVEPGAKLIVDGEQGINAPVNGNIIVKAKGDEMGEFYFNPTVNSNKHPKATVELNAKAYNNGSTYYYQRCGVPAFEGIHPSDIQKTYGASYWYWNTEISDWVNLAVADWSTFTFQPFQGFQVTSAATAEYQETYKFPVNLYGNVDGAIKYQAGWNYLANSYTGGMDVAAMLTDILSKDVLEAGVYAYTPNANTKDTWDLISALDIADGEAKQSKLDPMQAFVCRNKTGVEYTDAVNYENVVWNHRTEAKVTMAPARRTALAWDKVKVVVTSNDFSQAVTLRQSAQFSADYDNGGDITALENGTFNVYAVTELGNLAQVATDYLIGQTLTIDTKNAKSFKMTFENLNGETFAIRDNVTGSVIDMTEGAEYYFTADAYNGENRFEIVEARKMPTDVETVEAAKAQKGIYSLVGAYLGEDFDVLPAGIYVVNGVKVVK